MGSFDPISLPIESQLGLFHLFITQTFTMRKYVTGLCAILIAGLCLAFVNKKLPPGNCGSGSLIWYLVDNSSYWNCTQNLTQINPNVLALWGHETLFGQFSTNPRTELEAAGWLLTYEQFRDSEYECPGTLNEQVCAVAYDPNYVNSSTFTKVNVNGVWYWKPKEYLLGGPQVFCYLCKPN